MSPRILLLTCSLIFIVCCSMSKCKEDKTPGPSTVVHGVVRESVTGKPIPNVRFQVVKRYSAGILSGTRYADYDIVTTGDDGSYNLRFTPLGAGTFALQMMQGNAVDYYILTGFVNNTIILGTDNNIDFTLARLVNLNVHLKNSSNQNKTGFHVFILNCCVTPNIVRSDDYRAGPLDTTLKYKLPQLAMYTFQSLYYKGFIPSGPNVGYFADTLSFKQNFYLGRNDTTINVVNP